MENVLSLRANSRKRNQNALTIKLTLIVTIQNNQYSLLPHSDSQIAGLLKRSSSLGERRIQSPNQKNEHMNNYQQRMRVIKPKQQTYKPNVILDSKTLRDLPELGSVTCQYYQSSFDRTIKQYVLAPREDATRPLISINPIGTVINPQKMMFQVYLVDKLRLTIHMTGLIVSLQNLDQNERLFQFAVEPKQSMMHRSEDEVVISSSFILTKKWISLCFDFSSFFGSSQLSLKSLIISTPCKVKQIYETFQPIATVSDGQLMVQKITFKRLQELVDIQNRCQSEDRPSRRPQRALLQRQNTIASSRERDEVTLPPVFDKLLQKNVKIATGLQVIEEVQPKRKPGLLTQELPTQKMAAKKAVQSFIRHTDFSSPVNDPRRSVERSDAKPPASNPITEEFFNNLRTSNEQEFSSFYNSKVGKFSNTFQKPLGFSSMNTKLAQQNSNTFTQLQQHSTQDYFYLSSQQFQEMKNQSESHSHVMESQVEENIEAEEKDDMRSLNESLNTLGSLKQKQKKQMESSEDIVVSQFV